MSEHGVGIISFASSVGMPLSVCCIEVEEVIDVVAGNNKVEVVENEVAEEKAGILEMANGVIWGSRHIRVKTYGFRTDF